MCKHFNTFLPAGVCVCVDTKDAPIKGQRVTYKSWPRAWPLPRSVHLAIAKEFSSNDNVESTEIHIFGACMGHIVAHGKWQGICCKTPENIALDISESITPLTGEHKC